MHHILGHCFQQVRYYFIIITLRKCQKHRGGNNHPTSHSLHQVHGLIMKHSLLHSSSFGRHNRTHHIANYVLLQNLPLCSTSKKLYYNNNYYCCYASIPTKSTHRITNNLIRETYKFTTLFTTLYIQSSNQQRRAHQPNIFSETRKGA